METLNLVQGTEEWLAARAKHFTASEASTMMGKNPNKTRTELLVEKKTGIGKEISRYTEEVVFKKGHDVEALARSLAEKIIDDELFPATGRAEINNVPLLASFDGLTMDETVCWECKQWNQSKADSVNDGYIPECDEYQVIQQLVISKAKKCLYMVTDGTLAKTAYVWYSLKDNDEDRLIAGWKQFAKDLEIFEVPEVTVAPAVKQIESLPTLSIQVQGSITDSNLELFNNSALEFINNINTDLQTDEDFGNAENTIKFCKNAEKELDSAKKQIIGQIPDIDKATKTIDHLSNSMRVKRLELEKLVKNQKIVIKQNIVSEAQASFIDHVESLSNELRGYPTCVACDFGAAIKGKRNLDSMRNAANTALANAKIEADSVAKIMRNNLSVLDDKASDYKFLFNDLQNIIRKPTDDFTLVVASRIGEHQEAEKKRLEAEREKIRIEEERKAKAKAEEEQEKLRKQEAIDAQKIADDKKTEEPTKETTQKEVVEQADVGNEPVCADTDLLSKYIQAISSIETPILSNQELQETLNISALMISKAINNLCDAISESKAA